MQLIKNIFGARGCFTAYNKIKLLNCEKFIDDIEINDQILGYDNNYHQVNNKYTYNIDEQILDIQLENNKKIIGITKDHKVLAIKKEDYIEGKEYTMDDFKWYKINELDKGDYLIQI